MLAISDCMNNAVAGTSKDCQDKGCKSQTDPAIFWSRSINELSWRGFTTRSGSNEIFSQNCGGVPELETSSVMGLDTGTIWIPSFANPLPDKTAVRIHAKKGHPNSFKQTSTPVCRAAWHHMTCRQNKQLQPAVLWSVHYLLPVGLLGDYRWKQDPTTRLVFLWSSLSMGWSWQN